jgi:hypothetical protein
LQPLELDLANGDVAGEFRVFRRAELRVGLEGLLPRVGAPAGEAQQDRDEDGVERVSHGSLSYRCRAAH